jgi:hypothetical protein
MEVHHHPHVEKKNFKEYFLEFLMIFLAVTMGFFAENIRERITDNAKEKEYMQSMLSDIRADTAAITKAIAEWKDGNTDLDSIVQYLKVDPVNVTGFYNSLSKDFFHFDLFKYDNKTVEELKSSGNFRLIRNKSIENEIMSYDLDIKYILIQEQDVKELMITSKDIESKIADYAQINFLHFNKDSSYHLLNDNKQLIGEYYNKLLTFKKLANNHGYLFKQIKVKAQNLMHSIQSKYDLNNE